MKKYLYKNIVLFQTYGAWNADYIDGEKRFGLHRGANRTKAQAYTEAKRQVDRLNNETL